MTNSPLSKLIADRSNNLIRTPEIGRFVRFFHDVHALAIEAPRLSIRCDFDKVTRVEAGDHLQLRIGIPTLHAGMKGKKALGLFIGCASLATATPKVPRARRSFYVMLRTILDRLSGALI